MNDTYDDQRKFQRIPIQRPRQARDKSQRAFDAQANCIRIPKNVVLEAREVVGDDSKSGPLVAVRNFVVGLFAS